MLILAWGPSNLPLKIVRFTFITLWRKRTESFCEYFWKVEPKTSPSKAPLYSLVAPMDIGRIWYCTSRNAFFFLRRRSLLYAGSKCVWIGVGHVVDALYSSLFRWVVLKWKCIEENVALYVCFTSKHGKVIGLCIGSNLHSLHSKWFTCLL